MGQSTSKDAEEEKAEEVKLVALEAGGKLSIAEVLQLKSFFDSANPTSQGLPLEVVVTSPLLLMSPVARDVVEQIVKEGLPDPNSPPSTLFVTFDDLCEIIHLFSCRATHEEKAKVLFRAFSELSQESLSEVEAIHCLRKVHRFSLSGSEARERIQAIWKTLDTKELAASQFEKLFSVFDIDQMMTLIA